MDLTVVGFIIAVVGIVLQVADAFPEHRETRKVIVVLAMGVFVGIVASALLGAKYQITGNVDRQFALLYGLAGAGCVFGLIAILVGEDKRRQVAVAGAAAAAVLFCLAGFFVAVGSSKDVYNYSADEVLLLANDAERRGQYETAIDRFQELKGRLNAQGARDSIQKRIDRLQAAQAGVNVAPPK